MKCCLLAVITLSIKEEDAEDTPPGEEESEDDIITSQEQLESRYTSTKIVKILFLKCKLLKVEIITSH